MDTPVAFDALIDLDRGASPAAVEAVATAVRALPGANWINVEVHPAATGLHARLFPAGRSEEPAAEPWPALRLQVLEAAQAALATIRCAAAWTVPAPAPTGFAEAPAPTGFAEAMSPSQFDALAQLAALAGSTRLPPPAVAKPLPATDDVALTARLLAFVVPADTTATATAAVRHFGSFAAVLAAPVIELRRVPGLGTHSVAVIKLMHAAAIRLARANVAAAPVLDAPERLAAYLATALARERVEQFRILFLDEGGMLKADEVQARGTVNHTPVYPREVVRRALELGAVALVLVHNHPSGDPAPSPEDIEMTRQVRRAAAVMAVEVRDHVIVGNGRWLSFREAGLLA